MDKPKLLDRVHSTARLRHLSLSTERAYTDWIKRYILFHRKRHPAEMGAEEIRQFLSHLAVEGDVAASTQSVAVLILAQEHLEWTIQRMIPDILGWSVGRLVGRMFLLIDSERCAPISDGVMN